MQLFGIAKRMHIPKQFFQKPRFGTGKTLSKVSGLEKSSCIAWFRQRTIYACRLKCSMYLFYFYLIKSKPLHNIKTNAIINPFSPIISVYQNWMNIMKFVSVMIISGGRVVKIVNPDVDIVASTNSVLKCIRSVGITELIKIRCNRVKQIKHGIFISIL